MKYKEDKILNEVLEYIKTTYSKHYSTTKEGFQVQDILRHLDIDKDFSLSNAIKYLMRYGKKDGRNKMDLYKAIHYIVLLINSEENGSTLMEPNMEKIQQTIKELSVTK
ncbi:uncharacterized protein METZ01_LOCUS55557 [marine metagenome]|uniref:DUF3310 domain-containing protein n=1 Tax=marine metagenome TaxID=408172 RepID=A0A381SN31_9ZZZZ|tara:strand:+ start:622 stop:948 length:327 start_codon:yes stop_codon:yes gene_type:complete